jgi:GMP synthase (glutamine-hydrolysing)
MLFLAKLIPRILHNVNRVCYIFGGKVKYLINDVTHTHLRQNVLSQIRQADFIANEVKILEQKKKKVIFTNFLLL